MDTGSEVNLISAEVMTNNPGWAKHRRACNVKLNFGNASKGEATDCMENVPIEKSGRRRTCYGEFVPGNEERGPPCTLMRLRASACVRRASAVKKSATRNYVFLEINKF